jgi:hypothetical protein
MAWQICYETLRASLARGLNMLRPKLHVLDMRLSCPHLADLLDERVIWSGVFERHLYSSTVRLMNAPKTTVLSKLSIKPDGSVFAPKANVQSFWVINS